MESQQENQQQQFAKQIIEEDKKIDNIIDKIDKMMDAVLNHNGDVKKAAPIMKAALMSLDKQLKHFFDLQEHHRMLEDLKKDYPRVQHFVQTIYNEDSHLLKITNTLCDEIAHINKKSGLEEMQTLYKDYKDFVHQLKGHRDKINDLIMDTYNLDIGGAG